jgi:transcription initiation factor TFIIIB Brf1 subunit/transcription initiation factor TFIIB
LRKPGLTAYEEFSSQDRCPECREKLVDAGGEVACPSCGLVLGTDPASGTLQLSSVKLEVLGSYVGRAPSKGEHRPQTGYVFGVTRLRANSIGRDLSLLQCSGLIERVSSRFFLPKAIVQNAIQIAEKLLPDKKVFRVPMPVISAYSLLHACRSAGITHVGFDDLLKAYLDAGHRITKSQMLRVGRESSIPLPAIRPEALVVRAVAKLQSEVAITNRLKKAGLNNGRFFAKLLDEARSTATDLSSLGGFSPRTVAACSVYIAGFRLGPRVMTQREAAEALGIAEYTVRELCSRFRKQQEMR